MESVLILAKVLSVSSELYYTACRQCCSKINIYQGNQLFCRKCGEMATTQDTAHRYRLLLSISDFYSSCDVAVFGTQLEPYMGASAQYMKSYLQWMKDCDLSLDLCNLALQQVFTQKMFYFGFKLPHGHGLVKPYTLKDVLDSNASEYKSSLIAYQLISPDGGLYNDITVLQLLKRLAHEALQKRNIANTRQTAGCASDTDVNNASDCDFSQPSFTSHFVKQETPSRRFTGTTCLSTQFVDDAQHMVHNPVDQTSLIEIRRGICQDSEKTPQIDWSSSFIDDEPCRTPSPVIDTFEDTDESRERSNVPIINTNISGELCAAGEFMFDLVSNVGAGSSSNDAADVSSFLLQGHRDLSRDRASCQSSTIQHNVSRHRRSVAQIRAVVSATSVVTCTDSGLEPVPHSEGLETFLNDSDPFYCDISTPHVSALGDGVSNENVTSQLDLPQSEGLHQFLQDLIDDSMTSTATCTSPSDLNTSVVQVDNVCATDTANDTAAKRQNRFVSEQKHDQTPTMSRSLSVVRSESDCSSLTAGHSECVEHGAGLSDTSQHTSSWQQYEWSSNTSADLFADDSSDCSSDGTRPTEAVDVSSNSNGALKRAAAVSLAAAVADFAKSQNLGSQLTHARGKIFPDTQLQVGWAADVAANDTRNSDLSCSKAVEQVKTQSSDFCFTRAAAVAKETRSVCFARDLQQQKLISSIDAHMQRTPLVVRTASATTSGGTRRSCLKRRCSSRALQNISNMPQTVTAPADSEDLFTPSPVVNQAELLLRSTKHVRVYQSTPRQADVTAATADASRDSPGLFSSPESMYSSHRYHHATSSMFPSSTPVSRRAQPVSKHTTPSFDSSCDSENLFSDQSNNSDVVIPSSCPRVVRQKVKMFF